MTQTIGKDFDGLFKFLYLRILLLYDACVSLCFKEIGTEGDVHVICLFGSKFKVLSGNPLIDGRFRCVELFRQLIDRFVFFLEE